MNIGAEPKKVAILAGLVAVAAYLFFSGSAGDEAPGRAARNATQTAESARTSPPPPAAAPERPARRAQRPRTSRTGQEFRPSLTPARPEDRPDPMTIDPTLRRDLLAKLQRVEIEGALRNIFEFGKPPAPKIEEPKLSEEQLEEIREKRKLAAAKAAEQKNAKPAPPPINLKFYGFISRVRTSDKRAFFLEGEDIFVAGEGDVVKKRYKILKIGVNSAIVEDTEHKNKQTLKLEEQRG